MLLLPSLPWVLATPLMRKLPEVPRVRRDHRITRDLQHLHLARLIVEMDVQIISVMPSLTLESLAAPADRSPVDERSTPVTRMLNSLALEFLGRVDELVQLMLPPAGVMAPA